ncbi:MAG: cytochrome c-type biogenesis protein [Pseudomonadota bacterium]|nr:cytochrome c-type biogenesis protein [Pseudomonadota bacterium]
MAVIDVYEFEDEVQRKRYLSFIDELRCPKCQNQNLAGSDSPIAQDLRRELYRMLEEGKSDKDITDFMVARYGDYVLYKPQVKSNTYLLWGLPVGLFAVAWLVAALTIRKRRAGMSKVEAEKLQSEASDKARLKKLLDEADRRRDS